MRNYPEITKMKRILIIGCCGAGKTTLALELGNRLKIPVHHLDQLWWLPGWKEDSPENFDAKLAGILKEDRWIIDGNYNRTLPERLKYADTVIFLDYSRLRCIHQVLKRTLRFHGTARADMTPGCPERFDREFLRYVWHYNRDMRPRVECALKDFPGNVFRFKSPRQVTAFYSA